MSSLVCHETHFLFMYIATAPKVASAEDMPEITPKKAYTTGKYYDHYSSHISPKPHHNQENNISQP